MTRRNTFTQAELTRAISAAQKAGLAVARTEITSDARIVLHYQAEAEPIAPSEEWKRAREAIERPYRKKVPR